jgi:hypothetical protein
MAWFTRSSRFPLLAMALMLGLVVNAPALVQAQQSPSLANKLESAFRPPSNPGPRVPENTQAGGTRGREGEVAAQDRAPCMTATSKPLIALAPTSGVGDTMAEYPTVVWYMPELSADAAPAPAVEFVLKNAKNQNVYSATYPLAKSATGIVGSPGLMRLTVSNLYPLEIGQEYRWELSLKCNSEDLDSSQELLVEGGFRRVAPDQNFARLVQQASPQERVALYADRKLWFETINALIELRRDRPNDSSLAEAWDRLLSVVGLGTISKEPVFQSARNINNYNP